MSTITTGISALLETDVYLMIEYAVGEDSLTLEIDGRSVSVSISELTHTLKQLEALSDHAVKNGLL